MVFPETKYQILQFESSNSACPLSNIKLGSALGGSASDLLSSDGKLSIKTNSKALDKEIIIEIPDTENLEEIYKFSLIGYVGENSK